MSLHAFSLRDKQNAMAILSIFEAKGVIDSRFVRASIQRDIDNRFLSSAKASGKYRRGDRCSICGKVAIVVEVNTTEANAIPGSFTHAIQCQNRPASDQPWLPTHCGHTEYIVMGDK